MANWRDRVTSEISIHHGEPVIRGTRLAVSAVVAGLAEMSVEELLLEYPQICREDVQAALYFAAEMSHNSLAA